MHVKILDNQDLDRIDDLVTLFSELGYPEEKHILKNRFDFFIKHNDYYPMILIENNTIVGFSGMIKMNFYEKDGSYIRILAFVINSNYRKQGLGQYLLQESENLATNLGCSTIALSSGNRSERKNAHEFYLKNNFEKTSTGFAKMLLN